MSLRLIAEQLLRCCRAFAHTITVKTDHGAYTTVSDPDRDTTARTWIAVTVTDWELENRTANVARLLEACYAAWNPDAVGM